MPFPSSLYISFTHFILIGLSAAISSSSATIAAAAVVTETASVRRWINSSTIPVTVGGKTGTAQTGGDCDNALFVAAAPYNDPDVVISVVLEKGYSGGLASLTAARILEAYYSEK